MPAFLNSEIRYMEKKHNIHYNYLNGKIYAHFV